MNRIDNSKIHPHKYSQIIVNKKAKKNWWKKASLFLTKNARTNGHPHAKNKFRPFTKFNSKYIRELNIKCKTIKFLKDIGENPDNLGFVYDFLYIILKACPIKEIIDRLNFIKSSLQKT